jgi:hypothetical protein
MRAWPLCSSRRLDQLRWALGRSSGACMSPGPCESEQQRQQPHYRGDSHRTIRDHQFRDIDFRVFRSLPGAMTSAVPSMWVSKGGMVQARMFRPPST